MKIESSWIPIIVGNAPPKPNSANDILELATSNYSNYKLDIISTGEFKAQTYYGYNKQEIITFDLNVDVWLEAHFYRIK